MSHFAEAHLLIQPDPDPNLDYCRQQEKNYWILPQIKPDRIQIHWIRLDPDPVGCGSDPDPPISLDIRSDPDLDPVHPYCELLWC